MTTTLYADRARHKERAARQALIEAQTMARAAMRDYRSAGEPAKAETLARLYDDLEAAYRQLTHHP